MLCCSRGELEKNPWLFSNGGMGGELSPYSDIDLLFLYSRSSMGNLDFERNHDQGNLYPRGRYESGSCIQEVKEALVGFKRHTEQKLMLDARYIWGS